MNQLIAIMQTTTGWSTPWYNDPSTSAILWKAHRLGLVFRPSVSQVQWTPKGIRFAKKYGASV